MEKNTYRKRDAGFSGMVVYFTPNGTFVRSFLYQKGVLVPPPSKSSTTTTQQTNGLKLASPCDVSDNVDGKSVNSTKQTTGLNCTDWYLQNYINGQLISETYLYTTCYCDGDDGGGGGSTTPDPCTPQGTDPGDDDGGMGDPVCESCEDQQADFEAMGNGESDDSDVYSDSVDDGQGSDGTYYRHQNHRWNFYTFANGAYHFESYEIAYQSSSDGAYYNWYYYDIKHQSAYPTGSMALITVALTVESTQPTVASDHVGMRVDWHAVISATICKVGLTINVPHNSSYKAWY